MYCFLKCISLAVLLGCITARSEAQEGGDTARSWSFAGHLKYEFDGRTLPGNSLYRTFIGSPSADHGLETRLKFAWSRGQWDAKADYQVFALSGDSLKLADKLPGTALPVDRIVSDSRRWWDLTQRFGDDGRALVQRLDRLSIGHSSENFVWRFGRQAISWGNGLIFNPMDVFNPFDPAAVDKEYKTGDDMLYAQYLFSDGSDLQGVAVVRRNPVSGNVESDQSSLAIKYHGFLGLNEYDVLAASHYGEALLGIGGNVSAGGAVWRGDLTWSDTGGGVLSAVASASYSWTWSGMNVSGELEVFHNGFGQADGAYAPAELARNPALLERIARGELYTLARNYLAASATVELTPLLLLTPTLFLNLDDPSALAQVVLEYDLRQDFLLRAALNMPVGPDGSEYGGIESPIEGYYFSSGPGLFAQLAWYF
ncbi:MAG: hypothetical protein PVJ33_12980 [Lysobacterales bacterium]|jgi:hypothetical protein